MVSIALRKDAAPLVTPSPPLACEDKEPPSDGAVASDDSSSDSGSDDKGLDAEDKAYPPELAQPRWCISSSSKRCVHLLINGKLACGRTLKRPSGHGPSIGRVV